MIVSSQTKLFQNILSYR